MKVWVHLFLVDDGKYELPKVMMRAKSMEDEVVYVASTICSLISNGVDVSHIHLVHVTDDYFYSLKRIFLIFKFHFKILLLALFLELKLFLGT